MLAIHVITKMLMMISKGGDGTWRYVQYCHEPDRMENHRGRHPAAMVVFWGFFWGGFLLDFPFSRKVLWEQATTARVPIKNLNFEGMLALPLTPPIIEGQY